MDQIMDAAPKLRSALASRKCARTISATFMYILRGELGKRGPANHPPPHSQLLRFLRLLYKPLTTQPISDQNHKDKQEIEQD